MTVKFLSESQIVGLAAHKESINVPGVYFLILNKKVVYVGQSVRHVVRIYDHSRKKNFDSFYFIECQQSETDYLESHYIHMLKPKLNHTWKKAGYCAPLRLNKLLRIDL